jgi:hypothetical protein
MSIHDLLLLCIREHDIWLGSRNHVICNMMHSCLCSCHHESRASIHILWLESFLFQVKLDANSTWTSCWSSHGATESSSPVQPHLPGWGGPNLVCYHASRRYLQRGKVVHWRCPGPVGSHNLVCPSFTVPRSLFGTMLCCFGHEGGGCHKLTSGPPMT